jgi:hypothetical protein
VPQRSDQQDANGLTVPWIVLSVALGTVSLAALGTLAVVTSVKKVDVLSTVALALAILSFTAQLIVTLAQGSQAASVNAETKTALADMRATTDSLLANQKEQFNTVLGAALRQAVPAAVQDVATQEEPGAGLDENKTSDLVGALLYRVDEALARREPAQQFHRSTSAGTRDLTRRNQDLSTFPTKEEGERLVPLLTSLSPRKLAWLSRIATDSMRSPRSDAAVQYRYTDGKIGPDSQRLIEVGLIESVESRGDTWFVRLTADGWTAARLLRGAGDIPDWAQSLS